MYTLMLDGKLFLAPIDPNPQQVLDVGTGTGIWAMYFSSSCYVVEFLYPYYSVNPETDYFLL